MELIYDDTYFMKKALQEAELTFNKKALVVIQIFQRYSLELIFALVN